MTDKRKRGRPVKTFEAHALEAARVLDVALKLFQVRTSGAERRERCARDLGFANEAAAYRFVLKRRRGTVAGILADDVAALLSGAENRTRAALRLHLDHGVSLDLASRVLGKDGDPLDVRNLRREVAKAKRQRASVSAHYPSRVTDLN